jgi:predicted PurR-regulated permease PerM
LLLGTLSAVGNFFIVIFLGLTFAAQPSVYRNGLLYLAPAKHRARAAILIDRISDTLERWLTAQMVVMAVGAIVAGLVVVLASLASGWIAAASAFGLFLGVHALESYVLTPTLQRQALDIPPATLFAFQILLGIVFGIWGISLALPLMAIVKVLIDHFKAEAPSPEAA